MKQTPPFAYERILVATDFSADAASAAGFARRVFPGADFTVFHAYEIPYERELFLAGPQEEIADHYRHSAAAEARRKLEAFAGASGLDDAPRALRHGPAPQRIREYARRIDADLIVMGAEGRPAMQTAVLGSVSLRTVTEASCDVLLDRAARPSATGDASAGTT
ncbi:MAG: universal stress protein [Desulfobacterales bacterium]|nr:universal stress protein [Desulfobacterales bacterium]